MVGGAPLTDQYAKEIGADGYAPDAASAAEKFRAFLGQDRDGKIRARTTVRAFFYFGGSPVVGGA